MKFCNNKGFSLVSVMVAAGLLGGLSLAVMQVMKNIGDGQTRANTAADEAEMMVSVRMVLDNPNYCKISLAGEDPVGSPINFKKKDIDFAGTEINAGSDFTQASEGLDVALWYSNVAGDSRTLKKFNGADNPGSSDKSRFGKLNITSMKLVMNNGIGGCSGNYCEGTASDTGQLVVLYETKVNSSKVRRMKKIFSVNIGISTDSTGQSTILSCRRDSAGLSSGSCPEASAWICSCSADSTSDTEGKVYGCMHCNEDKLVDDFWLGGFSATGGNATCPGKSGVNPPGSDPVYQYRVYDAGSSGVRQNIYY